MTAPFPLFEAEVVPVFFAAPVAQERHCFTPEPRRATYAALDRMVAELPYGYFLDANGRIIIFNRRYRLLWQRLPDGTIERANPGEWIKWVGQSWFDADRIRYEKNTRDRLREILRIFFDGEDLTPYTTDDVRTRAES